MSDEWEYESAVRRLDHAFEASKDKQTTEEALAAWYRAFINGPPAEASVKES